MAQLVPIELHVTAGDTRPQVVWTMNDQSGAVLDLTSANRSVTLYYRDATGQTQWEVVLSKSGTPTDGKVTFTPSDANGFFPAGFTAPAIFYGWVHYVDSTVPHRQWFQNALIVYVDPAPGEA